MRFNQKEDKGVAGLTILLSVIVMLFSIGLLVMIFALMGAELQDARIETSAVVTNESIALTGTGINTIAHLGNCGFSTWNATTVMNRTVNAGGLAPNNTMVEGVDYRIFSANGSIANFTNWNASFVTYTYDWGGESCNVINDTTVAISDVTDWFAIFIVITAMVVLILLTVIIITAIRGSGMMSGEGTG